MRISGKYKITTDDKILREGGNIITGRGDAFILNRICNNEHDPITSLVMGKGTNRIQKSNTSLSIPSIYKSVSASVNLNDKSTIFSCSCTASEIRGVSEIGLMSNNILITRDVFDPISERLLSDNGASTVNIEYGLELTTGHTYTELQTSTEGNHIYYCTIPDTVMGVEGYVQKKSMNELDYNCYFHNAENGNLYVKAERKPNELTVNLR